VILRMAQTGDMLGLNSVLRGFAYDTTVKTVEPCRADFIPRADLLELMAASPAGTQAIMKLLSQELTELTVRTRLLLLPQTASAKLAKLLMDWSNQSGRVDRVFTHEEIAQMICSSRETVTRMLANMSRRNLIRVTSDSILISDYAGLVRMSLG